MEPSSAGELSAAIPPSLNDRISTVDTAWQPGADSARLGDHRWPGGATFSILGGGLGGAVDLSELHGQYETQPITALGVPGYTAGRPKKISIRQSDERTWRLPSVRLPN